MDNILEEFFMQYKILTEKMIQALSKDEIEVFEKILVDRQDIINKLTEKNYSEEQFNLLAEEFKIVEVENKLLDLTEHKKQEYKEEMNKARVTQNAHRSYNSNFTRQTYFIKEKI